MMTNRGGIGMVYTIHKAVCLAFLNISFAEANIKISQQMVSFQVHIGKKFCEFLQVSINIQL